MQYLLLLIVIISSIFANDELNLNDDFLKSLKEVSEIATKTKLNIDDSPSFVTVLHSDKLKQLGITNLFEALGLVPGVQLKKEASGASIVVFRGAIQKGEVKLMVDGVTINNAYRGSIYYYLDFPIEMIDRIEVIRGSGSVLYGSGAISGVVNIITNSAKVSSTNKIFISGGTYDNYKGGALVSANMQNIKIALDAYYQKNDKTVEIKPDASSQSGDSDRHLKDYSVGINMSNEHFSFLGRIKKSDIGNAYGTFSVLDKDENKFNNESTSIFAQLSYKTDLTLNNKINLLAGYSSYKQIVEAGHPSPAIDAINSDYKENSYFSEINLLSTSLKDNEFLIGVKVESSKTLKSQWSAILPYLSNPDATRKTTSIYLNDNYSATSNFDISAGLRYDSYSDASDSYSPNLGLVYRLNSKTRLKALYSHAFRAPSWIELSSNQSLEAETSDSVEAGVIFKANQQNTLRVNFYKSTINNLIAKNSAGKYVQNSKNNFFGSEIEYIYLPNNQLEVNFLASYIKAEDNNGDDLADVANILASSSLTYKLSSGFTFGSLLKYVSSSKRSDTDPAKPIRENDMPDSLIFDQTVTYIYKDITASLILKDLFDAGTYYALSQNSYGKDFDDDGRSLLLKISVEF